MSWPADGEPRFVPDHYEVHAGVLGVVYDRAYCWRPVFERLSGGGRAAAAAADELNRVAA